MLNQLRSVAFFAPGWPPGSFPNGVVAYVGLVRESLERLGLETLIAAPLRGGAESAGVVDLDRAPPSTRQRGVLWGLERLPRFRHGAPRFGWSIARALSKPGVRAPDLLEMEETMGAAWYVQQALDLPVVVRLHGPAFLNMVALGLPEDDRFRQIDRSERRCISQALGVTAPSRDVLDRVRSRYGIALADAQVIPNPAPPVSRERRWRLEASDRRTILFVGRFDRHKGGDIMFDAFREVATRLPDTELLFVGPDLGFRDDGGRVLSLASFLDQRLPAAVRARVTVTGHLTTDRIAALRRRAFLTVVPSRYENFPVALVEALAFGCPTIASRVGGIPEILTDGQTGLLFPVGDRSALADRIVGLFQNPQRAAELGARAADDIARRLDPAAIASTTRAYYAQLVERRTRARAPLVWRAINALATVGAPAR